MTAFSGQVLFALSALLQLDILVWVVGIPLLVFAVATLYLQQRQYRKLKEELAQLSKIKRHTIEYDLVLKAMKLSIWRVDVPTRSVVFESDYRDMSDSLTPAPGTSVEQIISWLAPQYVDSVSRGMADLMAGRIEDLHMQYEMKVPHSEHAYWAEGYATVDKRDTEGKPLTIVGTSMRIDRQKTIEKELIDARNHAEESDRLKSAFLANMSHEIRTPLNAIVGFSDILPMAQSDEERNQLIGLIKQNNAHLLRLFDDMVNMSKLEAGGGHVNRSTFPVGPLLQEVAEQYSSESERKGVPIIISESVAGQVIETDRDRLREIISQYVNNAMKFTEQGTVTISTELRDSLLRIVVSDTGKGIPADRCDDRLFERFVKVDEFVPGTGLGLSICRSLALSLGGKVGVESKLNVGSRFWVELPVYA